MLRGKLHEVVKWPEPVLAKRGAAVTEFGPELKTLVEEMFESMYAAQGIGLAAPQISISKRIAVVDLSFNKEIKDKMAMVNPEIVEMDGQAGGGRRLPESAGYSRKGAACAGIVKVRAQNVAGEWFEVEGDELLARALQHEIDHLDGVLFIDRLSRLKRRDGAAEDQKNAEERRVVSEGLSGSASY